MHEALPVTLLRYERLAELVREEIHAGALEVGDRLPGERELCSRFGVSRGTVRRALGELRDIGLIEPAARGWVVVQPSLGEPDALLSFSEMASLIGGTATADVLVARLRAATPEEAADLGLPGQGCGSAEAAPGDLFELTRLRRLDDVPVGLEVTRIPAHLAPFTTADFGQDSLYGFLRGHGVDPTRADYVVSAAVVSDWEASLLAVGPGSPVLVTSALTFDQHRRPIELSRSLFLADRYRFHATLLTRRATSHRSVVTASRRLGSIG